MSQEFSEDYLNYQNFYHHSYIYYFSSSINCKKEGLLTPDTLSHNPVNELHMKIKQLGNVI